MSAQHPLRQVCGNNRTPAERDYSAVLVWGVERFFFSPPPRHATQPEAVYYAVCEG
jgi:hypothetical protein